MSLYILTLNEAKRDLGLNDGRDDANLTAWMEGLQGRVDDFCCRTLLRQEDLVEDVDGIGTKVFYLRNAPVEKVTSLLCDTSYQFLPGSALRENVDFHVAERTGRVTRIGSAFPTASIARLGGTWPEGPGVIRVTYTAGYLATGSTPAVGQYALPEAIRRAFRLQLGYEWRQRTSLGVKSLAAKGGNITLDAPEWLPEVKAALTQYRRFA